MGIPQPFQPVFRVERIIIRRNDHIIFKFLRGVEHLFKGADIVAEADVQSLFFQAEQVCRELCFLRKFLLGQPEQDTVRRTALPGALAALLGAGAAMVLDVALLRRPFGLFLLYAGGSLLFSRRKDGTGGTGKGPSGAPDGETK